MEKYVNRSTGVLLQPAQESVLAAQPEAEIAAPQQAVPPPGEPAEKAFF